MEGYTYMQYIVPGLVMMSIITNAYSNVASSFFSLKFQNSIEEILIAPVPNWITLLGFVTGGVTRAVLTGTIVLLLSLFFTHLSLKHTIGIFFIAILVAWLFACAGLINAILAKKFDDIAIIPTFVLTPLTYLGGVFYSISLLPEFWQKVSLANPIFYMVNAFRHMVLGESDVALSTSLIMIIFFDVLILIIALYLFRRGASMKQ